MPIIKLGGKKNEQMKNGKKELIRDSLNESLHNEASMHCLLHFEYSLSIVLPQNGPVCLAFI